MTPLARRVISLESARHPRGTYLVEGVQMDMPAALGFFRRRHIAEADRKRELQAVDGTKT